MILGDTFASLLQSARTPTLVGLTLTFLLPLCLKQDLRSLAPFSLLGVLGMAYTAFAMTIRYLDGTYHPDGSGRFVDHLTPPQFRPAFGSKGAASVLSPNALVLVCMLSTAFMVRSSRNIQSLFYVGVGSSGCCCCGS